MHFFQILAPYRLIKEYSSCQAEDDYRLIGRMNLDACASECEEFRAAYFMFARDDSNYCHEGKCPCFCLLFNSVHCTREHRQYYNMYRIHADTGYSTWSSWTACKENGGLFRSRNRSCIHQLWCRGESNEAEKCFSRGKYLSRGGV